MLGRQRVSLDWQPVRFSGSVIVVRVLERTFGGVSTVVLQARAPDELSDVGEYMRGGACENGCCFYLWRRWVRFDGSELGPSSTWTETPTDADTWGASVWGVQ